MLAVTPSASVRSAASAAWSTAYARTRRSRLSRDRQPDGPLTPPVPTRGATHPAPQTVDYCLFVAPMSKL